MLRSVKKILVNFKPKNLRKAFFLTVKLKPYINESKIELISHGFCKLRPCSKLTWKFYGENHIRFTLFGIKDFRKYVIKVTKGFEEKTNNSIKFQNKFNDVFSFIPRGRELKSKDFKCYFTECINAIDFATAVKNYDVNVFLKQAIEILDELNKYKIVHCDLEGVNILVEKETNKIYIIDWDTVCSSEADLFCDAFPAYTIKRIIDNKTIYDDAYSFYTLFKRYGVSEHNELMTKIRRRIGRNQHIVEPD